MIAKNVIPASPSAEAYAVDEDQGEVFTRDEPFALFVEWFELAKKAEINDPNAMTLATVADDGMPNARVVLLKDISAEGLSFFTNLESAKGRELRANPNAALVFHWKSIRRQVRFRGAVERVSDADADAYFATRARGAQIGAWASPQSRPVEGPGALTARVAAETARWNDAQISRPPHWSGFRLVPREIEFWVNRPFRLHDRLLFTRSGKGWTPVMLFP